MINYSILNSSVEHYEKHGFTRIETPWLVSEYVDSLTRPKGVNPYVVSTKNKNLIASGEQGFLYLYLKEFLPKGRFQTITPCFRNDEFDFTHTKYFMKNELIDTENVTQSSLDEIVNIAVSFFESVFKKYVIVTKTGEGYDILYRGVELGSYGIRECDFLRWIYGTGCAEPRTSKLLNKK